MHNRTPSQGFYGPNDEDISHLNSIVCCCLQLIDAIYVIMAWATATNLANVSMKHCLSCSLSGCAPVVMLYAIVKLSCMDHFRDLSALSQGQQGSADGADGAHLSRRCLGTAFPTITHSTHSLVCQYVV